MPIVMRFDDEDRMEFKVKRFRRAPDLSRDTYAAFKMWRSRKGGGIDSSPFHMSGRGLYRGGAVGDRRQNCYVHVQYPKKPKPWLSKAENKSRESNAKMAKAARVEYIKDEGKGLDGKPIETFGTSGDLVKDGVDGNHYFVTLSPEKKEVDHEMLTRAFVKSVEVATGYKFEWTAGTHYDTEHPHTHLIIDGHSKDGREIFIPPNVIKKQMRNIARDALTAAYGKRSQAEMDEGLQQSIATVGPVGFLDRLVGKKIVNGEVKIKDLKDIDRRVGVTGRLENLYKMGVVDFENGKYLFGKKWKGAVHEAGRHCDYQEGVGFLRTKGFRGDIQLAGPGIFRGEVKAVLDGKNGSPRGALVSNEKGQDFYVPVRGHNEGFKSLVPGDEWSVRVDESKSGAMSPVFLHGRSPIETGY